MIGKRYYEIKASILKWQRCHAKNNISGGYSWDGCSLEEHCVGSCILWYMTWQVCQIHFGSGSLAPSRFKESWGLGTSFRSPCELDFSFRCPGKFLFKREVSRGVSGGRSLAYVIFPCNSVSVRGLHGFPVVHDFQFIEVGKPVSNSSPYKSKLRTPLF